MNKSEQINDLAAALNKAQSQMNGAKKGAKNPFFKSKYADLVSVVDAVKGPFVENGLSYSQFPVYEDGKVGVETILMHSSGQWISNILLLPMTKQDPQAAGSAITYARRYALQAIAGIPAEDDDGNAATHGQKFTRNQNPVNSLTQSLLQVITDGNDRATADYWRSLNQDQQQQAWSGLDKETQKSLKAITQQNPA